MQKIAAQKFEGLEKPTPGGFNLTPGFLQRWEF
jgi:hypothetical protein